MDMENLHAHRPKSAEITMQTLATDDEKGMLMPVRTQSYRSLRSFWVRVLSAHPVRRHAGGAHWAAES